MAESVTLARQGSWSLADDAQSTDQDPFLVDSNTEFDTKRELVVEASTVKILYNVLGSPVKGRGKGDDQSGYRRPILRKTHQDIVVKNRENGLIIVTSKSSDLKLNKL